MNYLEFFKSANNSSLSGAYLLHGDEEFIKETAITAAKEMIPAEFSAFNTTVLREAELGKLIDACETLPLMFDRSLVIIREFASGIDADELTDYINNLPSTTVLLICCKGKVNEKSKILKFFKESDREVLFSEVTEQDAVRWCMQTALKQGTSIDTTVARTFVQLVGRDMSLINNELQKLIYLVGEGGVITQDAVSKCVISNVEFQVFEMLDSFTSGKVLDGMRALHGLLSDRDEAFRIAGFLESRFKVMLEGRLLMDSGLTPSAAASRMEGSRFANEKACRAASRYSVKMLAGLIGDISMVGYNAMTGGGDAAAALEAIMAGFDWNGLQKR